MTGAILIVLAGIAAIIFFASRSTQWRKSSNGNDTRRIGNLQVTVFPSDGGWKFCLADSSDRSTPYFSDPYDTEDAAKHEAIAFIGGGAPKFLTKRSQREQRVKDQSPELVATESGRLDKLEQSLARALSKTEPKHSTLENIRKNAKKRASQSDHLENQMIQARADGASLDRIAAIRSRYWEIKWQIDALIGDDD